MFSRVGRLMLMVGATTSVLALPPATSPAYAQRWGSDRSCSRLEGRDRARCERDRHGNRWDRERDRREHERDRRKDAKKDGIVAGVVGTAILGGIIAAAASSNKKKKEDRNRRDYCEDRYGNYDERTDSYRASDGRSYRCE